MWTDSPEIEPSNVEGTTQEKVVAEQRGENVVIILKLLTIFNRIGKLCEL